MEERKEKFEIEGCSFDINGIFTVFRLLKLLRSVNPTAR